MFEGKAILVVDDEADLREILRDELLYEGAIVKEASNGIEALKHLRENAFDAVLSDIRMPGGDGASLTREIRQLHNTRPIVVLITGFADLHSEEAFDMGADAYVTKPFHLEELKKSLERLLRPPQSRWVPDSVLTIHRHIAIQQTLDQAISQGIVRLGRGGLFLQVDPQSTHIGDIVDLKTEGLPSLQAQVKWVRSEKSKEGKVGLGLEFLHVPLPVLQRIAEIDPNWNSAKMFIPRN